MSTDDTGRTARIDLDALRAITGLAGPRPQPAGPTGAAAVSPSVASREDTLAEDAAAHETGTGAARDDETSDEPAGRDRVGDAHVASPEAEVTAAPPRNAVVADSTPEPDREPSTPQAASPEGPDAGRAILGLFRDAAPTDPGHGPTEATDADAPVPVAPPETMPDDAAPSGREPAPQPPEGPVDGPAAGPDPVTETAKGLPESLSGAAEVAGHAPAAVAADPLDAEDGTPADGLAARIAADVPAEADDAAPADAPHAPTGETWLAAPDDVADPAAGEEWHEEASVPADMPADDGDEARAEEGNEALPDPDAGEADELRARAEVTDIAPSVGRGDAQVTAQHRALPVDDASGGDRDDTPAEPGHDGTPGGRDRSPDALAALLEREAGQDQRPSPSDLLATAYAGLHDVARRLAAFEAQLDTHDEADGSAISLEARRVRKRIRAFEPSVAVIGQIKAGKTTLVNAMAGWPGLLPADVNPWTSVVTSLHLGAQGNAEGQRATFQFFDERTWANLVQRGGRVGELAGRAGADAELDKVRRQLDEMREKSRRRLGRRFEMLLGQTHDYEEFDEALIERYVCMGDDFWEDDGASRQKGRFADITRSADLWFPRPETPLALCLRDTPGVNDTFMIREQITINALRGSRLCVMVLSAHQALTSVDLALIRLISNIKARDVVIFVNRIDELAEPAAAVPEIEASIRATLKKFEGPEDVRIVFGSGHWAEKALTGDTEGVGSDSAQALLDYAGAHPGPGGETVQALLWRLSGVPELSDALARRIEAGAGAQFAAQIETAIGNLDRGAALAGPVAGPGSLTPRRLHIDAGEVARALSELEQRALATLEERLAEVRGTFDVRIEKSRQSFLGRATASLLKHLEDFGEGVVWSYDPVGLRTLLRSAYQVYVRGAAKAGEETMAEAAAALDALYARAFGAEEAGGLTPPPLPQAPAPVALGQTIALDLRGSWWTRFWRRTRGYEAFAESFAKLIHEETGPIVGALQHETADPYQRQLRAAVMEFVGSQRSILTDLATPAGPVASGTVRPLRTAPTPQPDRPQPDRKVQPMRPPRPQGSSRTARLQRQGE